MSETVPYAVELQDVFRREKGADAPILAAVGMRVRAGTLVAVVGADGAGKTTLMRIMAGILQPSQGLVRVFGMSLNSEAQTLLGYMPQKFGLYEDLSVAENLALYADLFGLSERHRREREKALLRMTGLAPFTERIAGRLSGGMKQKLGLACALLNHPKILLLDEPSVGVDPLSRRDLWRMLRAQVQDGMTVVAATTSMDEAALCDEVVILEEGRIRTAGTPEAIASEAEGRTVLAVQPNAATPLRMLQAAFWDRTDLVSDAIPAAGGVALVLREGVKAEDLSRAFPSVTMRPRTPTLEDGYLCARERLLGAMPRAQIWPWLLATQDKRKERCAIRADNLVRRFGAFTAVDRTSFEVRSG
ncbi:MAG: ATP-binding cassette domain-containing protein, partial [Duodenibacillus sp.]